MKNKARTSHFAGYGIILLSSVMFSTYGLWSKIMGDDFGVFYQAWVRALIVLIIIMPILVWKKQFVRVAREDYKWLGIVLGFTIFTQVPLYYAYINTGMGTATLLFYAMFIIASYGVGVFLMREKMTWPKVVSLLLAFVGIGLVFHVSCLIFSALGLLMAGLNGIASGGEVSSSKTISDKYPTLLITFYSWLAILLTHLPVSLIVSERQFVPTMTVQWGAMMIYAVVSLLAFWLVVEGFRRVDASVGSLMGLAEIVWALIFGVVFFDENISPTMIVGAMLILAAGILPDALVLWQRKRSSSQGLREIKG